jgi:hypothetical protein
VRKIDVIRSTFANKPKSEKFKFKVNSIVRYTGKLFEELTGKEAVVIRRSHSKCKSNYDVQFIHDGRTRSFMESVLEQVENKQQEEIT